jgi:hypothetical protein
MGVVTGASAVEGGAAVAVAEAAGGAGALSGGLYVLGGGLFVIGVAAIFNGIGYAIEGDVTGNPGGAGGTTGGGTEGGNTGTGPGDGTGGSGSEQNSTSSDFTLSVEAFNRISLVAVVETFMSRAETELGFARDETNPNYMLAMEYVTALEAERECMFLCATVAKDLQDATATDATDKGAIEAELDLAWADLAEKSATLTDAFEAVSEWFTEIFSVNPLLAIEDEMKEDSAFQVEQAVIDRVFELVIESIEDNGGKTVVLPEPGLTGTWPDTNIEAALKEYVEGTKAFERLTVYGGWLKEGGATLVP